VKLSPLQQKVLAHISWNARVSPEELAGLVGARVHTARYAVRQLVSDLKLRPYCFTDPFRMGLIPYRALFSINTADRKKSQRLISYLQNCPDVSWLQSLHGYYQFLMAVRVSGTCHLDTFMSEFDSHFGDMIVSKTLAELSRTTFFVPWLAHSGRGTRKSFEYRHDTPAEPLDSVARGILEHLKLEPLASISSIARAVGLPASTVSYRFGKLIESRVILGFAYSYQETLIGSQAHLILAKLRGLAGGGYEQFFDFAAAHPRVCRISRMIGDWDLEIEVQLEAPGELDEIIHQLYSLGGGMVRELLLHTWGPEYQPRNSGLQRVTKTAR
jgi:DNA-binding Lrp family transcriptional regulator